MGDLLESKITKENFDSKKHVKEIKCVCRECGKIWHYLPSDEAHLRLGAAGNAMMGCGSLCSPFSPLYSNKAAELGRQANQLSKCPNCNSSNVTKEEVYHEKKQ